MSNNRKYRGAGKALTETNRVAILSRFESIIPIDARKGYLYESLENVRRFSESYDAFVKAISKLLENPRVNETALAIVEMYAKHLGLKQFGQLSMLPGLHLEDRFDAYETWPDSRRKFETYLRSKIPPSAEVVIHYYVSGSLIDRRKLDHQFNISRSDMNLPHTAEINVLVLENNFKYSAKFTLEAELSTGVA